MNRINYKQVNTSDVRPRFFLLIGIGLFCGATGQAQVSVNSSGGNASGSGGSVAFSIGQVVYTTHSTSSGIISQGVQQAYEIYKLEILETEMNILLSVFPNPTEDHLTLQISNYNNEKLFYQLVDLHGKLLDEAEISADQTQVNTANFSPSTYFLYVVNEENKKVQSFKIIKNN